MLIDKLREHLDSISDEQFLKEWNELDDWKDVGPTAEEVLKNWKHLYPNDNER